MINNKYFDIIFIVILLFHMIIINDVKPKSSFLSDTNVTGVILPVFKKGLGSNISDFKYSKIENGILSIYDNELYTQSTNVSNINLYNSKKTKIIINNRPMNIDEYKNELYKDLFGFNIYRPSAGNDPEINVDIFFQTNEDKKKWITAIRESDDITYGKQSDGSMVLNDIQTEIKKYLGDAKELEIIIYGNDSSPLLVKEATAKLIALRSKLDNQIKKYENPKNLENILDGTVSDIKDIKSCECSIGKLRTATMYINSILPAIIIIIFTIQYFNININESWIYKQIFGITGDKFASDIIELIISRYKIFMYAVFFLVATAYHVYLLSSCQCSIPTQTQKGLSFFFMIFFPLILVVEALTK